MTSCREMCGVITDRPSPLIDHNVFANPNRPVSTQIRSVPISELVRLNK